MEGECRTIDNVVKLGSKQFVLRGDVLWATTWVSRPYD